MNKNKKCECKEFYASENYFLKGSLVNEVLYIKATGDSDGIENIRCVECNKEINSSFKIEVC